MHTVIAPYNFLIEIQFVDVSVFLPLMPALRCTAKLYVNL